MILRVEEAVRDLEKTSERVREDYPGLQREYFRRKAVDMAIALADRVIMSASDGSVEETDWLTAEVALRFAGKVALAANNKLLRKDFMERKVNDNTSGG